MAKNTRIIVGMSGGVDSTAAIILLKEQGYNPIGVSLKLPVWNCRENLLRENLCCTEQSLAIAKSVCRKLKVPYYVLPKEKKFTDVVVDYFTSEYRKKRTPNPCVYCNRYFKFKELFDYAKKMGVGLVATGHYAKQRYNQKTKKYELVKPKDKVKDQTYNLSFLTQSRLAKVIFPLSDLTKEEVYKLVKRAGLNIYEKKKQSQDFCFVAGKSLSAFLEANIGLELGDIVDEKSNKLGIHQGLHFYTIGQRKGIKVNDGPWFVKKYDLKKNKLIVTKNEKELLTNHLKLYPYNLISGHKLTKKIKVIAKIRYQQKLSSAELHPEGKKIKVVFNNPQRAATIGQLCAFYKADVCLGGGIILAL